MSSPLLTNEHRTPDAARRNPRAGDILKRGPLMRRVVERESGNVWYVNNAGARRLCWISTWINWARKAEVVAHVSALDGVTK